jgi:catechol 2,3-dioxygenase-like lactoylglutathione lyase family enzyme
VGKMLDHLILPVVDLDASSAFYAGILGFQNEGEQEPFTIIRVAPDCIVLLAPWSSSGDRHLAFSMARSEFDDVFRRVRDAGIPFGDAFDSVGNMKGPGTADGALGSTTSLYFQDPSANLIEILHYESRTDT